MKPASSEANIPFKSAYTPTETVALSFPPEEYPYGKTKQSFKDDSDINNIMARYQATGVIDFVNEHAGHYADVTGLEYQSMLNKVIEAEAMFMDLPAELRKRFSNDPAEFLAFVQDEHNRDEAVTLGLIPKRSQEAANPLSGGPEPKAPTAGSTPPK
ncbi:MAG: internal scaffolding protein [Microviridae sp.]|nr:MAG: internal scaffolding protein [Microviridae sp.]